MLNKPLPIIKCMCYSLVAVSADTTICSEEGKSGKDAWEIFCESMESDAGWQVRLKKQHTQTQCF